MSVTTSTTVIGTITSTRTITTTIVDTSTTTATTTDTTSAHEVIARHHPHTTSPAAADDDDDDCDDGIPIYAWACDGIERYSSACSCIGVTAGTITSTSTATLATPTMTVTKTTTSVVTVAATSVTTALDTVTKTTQTVVTVTVTTVPTITCSPGTQIVVNPSFEDAVDYHPSGWSTTGNLADYTYCAEDGSRCEYYTGNGGPVSSSISQTLTNACKGSKYGFSAYVGFYNSGVNSPYLTYITVTLGGVTIIPRQLTCGGPQACSTNIPNSYDWYREITAVVTVTQFDPLLVITLDSPASSEEIFDTMIDNVTLVQL